MKKLLRLISLVLSAILLCLAFCGCVDLDEGRKHHAFWKDDEKTVIVLNDKEYKLLPESEYLNPFCETVFDYWVTDSDVPLLLKEMYGDSVSLSADENFILVYDEYETETEKIYCAVDRYEEICGKINSSYILEYFCYEYGAYDAEKNEYVTKFYRFTDEENEAVLNVLDYGAFPSEAISNYPDYSIEVYRCSEDMIFRNYAFDLVFEGSNAYLKINYVNDDEYQTDSITLVVPDELYSTFWQMADEYVSNEYGR